MVKKLCFFTGGLGVWGFGGLGRPCNFAIFNLNLREGSKW